MEARRKDPLGGERGAHLRGCRQFDQGVKWLPLGGALLPEGERVVEMMSNPIRQIIVDQHERRAGFRGRSNT